jgi:hypothetical protein
MPAHASDSPFTRSPIGLSRSPATATKGGSMGTGELKIEDGKLKTFRADQPHRPFPPPIFDPPSSIFHLQSSIFDLKSSIFHLKF